MRNRSLIYLTAALSMVQVCLAQTGTRNHVDPRFSITITVPQTTLKIGSRIAASIKLKNTSERGLVVSSDRGFSAFRFDVFDDQGKRIRAAKGTSFLRDDEGSFGTRPRQIVSPGGTYREDVDLSKEFELVQPGTYTLQVSKLDPETMTVVRSNKIQITLTQ